MNGTEGVGMIIRIKKGVKIEDGLNEKQCAHTHDKASVHQQFQSKRTRSHSMHRLFSIIDAFRME